MRGDLEGFYSIRINDQWQVTSGGPTATRPRSKSWITTESSIDDRTRRDERRRICAGHLGEMLKDKFLAEYRLSQSRLARAVGISPNRIAEIVNNRRRITADTALRLGLYFGTSAEF